MQIGLKERLIGAVVLVILAIIIIPWVLKGGSAPSTTVTQKLALPQATTAPTAQTTYHLALNGPMGSSTVPAAGAAVQTAPEVSSAQTAAAVTAPLPAAKPSRQGSAPPRVAPAPAIGKWVVQAGSYGNERNALAVEHQLVKHGLHAYISRYHKSGRNYYRVRVGPYPERTAAERAVKEVQRAAGGHAEVVPET